MIVYVLLIATSCSKGKQVQGKSQSRTLFGKRMLTGIEVSGIRLLAYPKYSGSGESWDPMAPFSTNPDLFLSILWNGNTIYKSEVHEDQEYGNVVSFTQGLPLQLKPFDQPLTIELFDEDGVTADDNMGYLVFTPNEYEGKEAIELQAGALKVELKMKWNYAPNE